MCNVIFSVYLQMFAYSYYYCAVSALLQRYVFHLQCQSLSGSAHNSVSKVQRGFRFRKKTYTLKYITYISLEDLLHFFLFHCPYWMNGVLLWKFPAVHSVTWVLVTCFRNVLFEFLIHTWIPNFMVNILEQIWIIEYILKTNRNILIAKLLLISMALHL